MTTVPANYPGELAEQVTLIDGSAAWIRPILPDDSDGLVAFHEELSPETVYRRFFSPHPHLTPKEVEHFTTVDYRDRMALVAVIGGHLAAVGRYDRTPGTDRAEVAFVVADAYQQRGLATLLLERLATAARGQGISRFEAETLERNRLMREVFRHAGYPCEERFANGVVEVTFPIDHRAPIDHPAPIDHRVPLNAPINDRVEMP